MRAILLWMSYVWMTTLAGLAIHPYKSVKKMVLFEKALLPVVLSPLMGLAVLFVVGRVGSRLFELVTLQRELAAGLLGSSLIGLLMWQGLLLILVVRFWRVK